MATISFSRGTAGSTEEWVDFCRRAERAGLSRVWAADTVGHDCFIDATLALQATERLEVGTAIAYPVRTPLQTAMAAATLATYWPGRFTLGIGHGGADNRTNNGIPTNHPVPRLRDYLLAIRTILRSDRGVTAEYEGPYERAKGQGYGLGPLELPILIGGFGQGMTRLAARFADGMVFHNQTARPLVRKRREDAERLRPAGSLPFIAVAAHPVAVHPDEGVALRRARAGLTFSLRHFRAVLGELAGQELSDRVYALLDAGRLEEAGDALPEEVVRSFVVVSTPHRMKDDLLALDDSEQVLVGLQKLQDGATREAYGFTEAEDAEIRAGFLAALFG
jgi:alkanesulfonate monooxygenase SsuD/methylene tetrahydromethanopterin reductase-like flavin-dependent oxidoreductase (luciferase family)